MKMVKICLDGLPISFIRMVAGQVGMQFRMNRDEHVDVMDDIYHVLCDAGHLIHSDRIYGFVMFITNFASIDEAARFFKDLEFKSGLVLLNEFELVLES